MRGVKVNKLNMFFIAVLGAVLVLLYFLLIIGCGVTSTQETVAKTVSESAKTVTITQTVTAVAEEPKPSPGNVISGTGQQASEMFTLEKGLAKFYLAHDGQHHFGIWLMDDQGQNIDLLVNETGPFDGSKAVKIPNDGTYILDISADGNWTVTIEQ
ncbi:MAG: hypothetical protein ACYC5A_01175 [Thermoleophilia bacterium]